MIFLEEFLSYIKKHSRMVAIGTISALAYTFWAINSQGYGELQLTEFLVIGVPCAALSIYLCMHYVKSEEGAFPVYLMLGFALVFRLLGVSTFPILEDDFYRFLWDGRMSIETGTPYGWVPIDFFNDINISDSFEQILGSINHPEVATIYGPVTQTIFALAYVIAPAEVWPIQMLYASIDFALILLLLRVAKPHFVLLYAWSPLILKEFAISAHPDVLGALFLVLAFIIYSSKTKYSWLWLPICLALATGVKVFALIAVPLFLRFQWRSWCIWVGTLFILALPFISGNESSSSASSLLLQIKAVWLPDGLQVMSNNWLFNAPFYYLADTRLAFDLTKGILLGLFAIVAASYFMYLYLRRQYLPMRIDRLYGLFFICIPVINPWYLVWLLPFAVIYPSRWAWTASIAVFLAYATGINLNNSELALYQHSTWVLCVEYGLIVLALCIDWHKRTPINTKISTI